MKGYIDDGEYKKAKALSEVLENILLHMSPSEKGDQGMGEDIDDILDLWHPLPEQDADDMIHKGMTYQGTNDIRLELATEDEDRMIRNHDYEACRDRAIREKICKITEAGDCAHCDPPIKKRCMRGPYIEA